MRVALRHRCVGVAEHLLNHRQCDPQLEREGRSRVAGSMRADVADARGLEGTAGFESSAVVSASDESACWTGRRIRTAQSTVEGLALLAHVRQREEDVGEI